MPITPKTGSLFHADSHAILRPSTCRRVWGSSSGSACSERPSHSWRKWILTDVPKFAGSLLDSVLTRETRSAFELDDEGVKRAVLMISQAEIARLRMLFALDVLRQRGDEDRNAIVVLTLEAALWCVERMDSFADAVLLAANLADDADTVAAVTRQISGALWGSSAIPAQWLSRLA
jgi:hypothetical protein